MSFQVKQEGEQARVMLTGDIDLENSPRARKALLAAVKAGKPVVVDLAGVDYIDSSGIASLVEAHQKAQVAKIRFSLARVGPQVLKVLKLARLDQVFTIEQPA